MSRTSKQEAGPVGLFDPPTISPPADDVPFNTEGLSARLLPEGVYKARTIGQELTESKGGTPQVEFTVLLSEKEKDDGSYIPLSRPVRRTVRGFLSSPKATEITFGNLLYLGWPRGETDVGKLDPTSEDKIDLTGKDVLVAVKHEEYNEVVRDRVDFVRRRVATPEERRRVISKAADLFAAVAAQSV